MIGLVALAGAAGVAAAPPTNDDFASGQVLAASGGTLASTNVGASKEVGEPDHGGDAGGSSVWFRWTPSFTGMASLDTAGSDFDTLLGVYTGSAVSNLTLVAGNDDVGASASSSRACFHVDAGSTVTIAVDGYAQRIYAEGYNGDTGDITLNWGPKTDAAPCSTLPPLLTGAVDAPKVGNQIQFVPGTFTDAGQATTQRWVSCTVSCSAIAGATGGSYTVAPSDVGRTLAVETTSSDGTTTVHNQSAPTAVVTMTPVLRQNGRIFFTTSRVTGGFSGGSDIFSVMPDGSSLHWLSNFMLGVRLSEAAADPSPDGSVVAFSHNGQLALMAPDGSEAFGLGISDIYYPTWSPEGDRIAFVYDTNTGGSRGIAVSNADGTNFTSIFHIAAGNIADNLAWSPDGGRIAFGYLASGPKTQIAVISADGHGKVDFLTSGPVNDHSPAWSPDGTRIAFARGASQSETADTDLYVMNADGSNATKLVDGDQTHIVRSAAWSPDGTTILFSEEEGPAVPGSYHLFTVPAAGGQITELPLGGGDGILPAWGPLVRYSLDLNESGGGAGSVASAPSGVSCAATCAASFDDGTTVTLTATAAPGSTFTGWAGACSGVGVCTVSMIDGIGVSANFAGTAGGGSGGGGGGGAGGGSGPVAATPNFSFVPSLPHATSSQTYVARIVTGTSDPLTLTIAAGAAPDGIGFDDGTYALSGSPRGDPGSYTFTVEATDTVTHASLRHEYTLVVDAPRTVSGGSSSKKTTAIRANAARTPGAYNPAVTQATIRATICRVGWTARVRPPTSFTARLKLKQMRQYHETGAPSHYEEDYLIPLELGGATRDPRNLWPEPRPRANTVDALELTLKRKVCAGTLTLAAARHQISTTKHTTG